MLRSSWKISVVTLEKSSVPMIDRSASSANHLNLTPLSRLRFGPEITFAVLAVPEFLQAVWHSVDLFRTKSWMFEIQTGIGLKLKTL